MEWYSAAGDLEEDTMYGFRDSGYFLREKVWTGESMRLLLPLVSSRVLYESGLVTETVTAVLAHTMEMGLVLPVTAVRVMAVLVEPEPQVPLGHGLVLEYAHGVLDAGLPHLRAHVPRRRRPRPVVVRRRSGHRVVSGRRSLAGPVQQSVVR